MKYRIVLNGVVQGVGCRYLVKAAAKKFHLGGIARNTEKGEVEIYTESNSDQIIQQFIETIKNSAKNTMIDIMKVAVYTEEQNEFLMGKPPREYRDFVIDAGF